MACKLHLFDFNWSGMRRKVYLFSLIILSALCKIKFTHSSAQVIPLTSKEPNELTQNIRSFQQIPKTLYSKRTKKNNDAQGSVEIGTASIYSPYFDGRRTTSGEIFRSNKISAAHKFLPIGTKVKVTNLENGCSIEIMINDRLPEKSPHSIDLSKMAARQIEVPIGGIAKVQIEQLRAINKKIEFKGHIE